MLIEKILKITKSFIASLLPWAVGGLNITIFAAAIKLNVKNNVEVLKQIDAYNLKA